MWQNIKIMWLFGKIMAECNNIALKALIGKLRNRMEKKCLQEKMMTDYNESIAVWEILWL